MDKILENHAMFFKKNNIELLIKRQSSIDRRLTMLMPLVSQRIHQVFMEPYSTMQQSLKKYSFKMFTS